MVTDGSERAAGVRARLAKMPPLARDAVLVGVLIPAGLLQQFGAPHPGHEDPGGANPIVHAAVIVAAILPLMLRRRFPFLTVVIMCVVMGGANATGPLLAYDPSPAGAFGLYFAVLNAASIGGRLKGWAALALALVTVTVMIRPWITPAAAWLPNYFFPLVAFVAGRIQWQRMELTRILQGRLFDEQTHRERLRELSLQEVRTALARDVHDVVVSALRAMSEHAREAHRRLTAHGESAEQALRAAEDTGRRALAELRLLLEVLRGGDAADGRHFVHPDLHGLEAVVRRSVPSTVDLRARIEGDMALVPHPVALAAWRFVQDTLATATRGPEGRVAVQLTVTDDELVAEVRDDRHGPADAVFGWNVPERLKRRGPKTVARFPLNVRAQLPDVVDRARPGPLFRGRSFVRRLGRRGWPVDVALVAILVTGSLLEFSIWEDTIGASVPPEVFSTGAYVWGVALALLLLFRRPAPVLIGVAIAVMLFLQTYPFRYWTAVSNITALQVAVYTIGSLKPGRSHAWAVAVLGGIGIVSIPPPPVTLSIVGFLVIMVVTLFGAAYVGTIVGERRRLNAELDVRLAELADERRTELALALQRERLTLAREMHDLVAHSITLMVVQAGAARTVADTDPRAARRAVQTVVDNGDKATAELEQLLALLKTGSTDEPQPAGARDVGELVDHARQSGLAVDLDQSGDRVPAAGGSLELSAYRIVQEALTNARKHAPGSRVSVRVRFESDSVAVRVENEGTTAQALAPSVQGAGRGLVGMRERVAMFGGRFEAGPVPGGRFVVDAWMPLEVVTT